MSSAIDKLIVGEHLPSDYRKTVDAFWRGLSEEIAMRAMDGPVVVGINGAQGSGKSTLCQFLEVLLVEHNQRSATLSIDDLYLTKAERERLGREVHPLLATRGVPGTHDAALGLSLIEDFRAGRDLDLPRFDKSVDDRSPERETVKGPLQVLLFEGWCLGAVPQDEAALAEPVNDLEATEDPDLAWRRYVNEALDGAYKTLFEQLDMLVMLKVPDFAAVRRKRALNPAPTATGINEPTIPDSPRLPAEKSARCIEPPLPRHTPVRLPNNSAINGESWTPFPMG